MRQGENLEAIHQILRPLRKPQRKTMILVIHAMAEMIQVCRAE